MSAYKDNFIGQQKLDNVREGILWGVFQNRSYAWDLWYP